MHVRLASTILVASLAFVIAPAVPAGAETDPAGCDLIGTEGDDVLTGTSTGETICGLGGDDKIYGGGGDDRLVGGDGNDVLVGGPGSDVLHGNAGDDSLAGGDGADTLWGGEGNDLIRGARGPDTLYGGPGRDVVRGGVGVDRLRGGPDTDVCLDHAVRTNAVNCEYGKGGEEDPVEVSKALWAVRGDVEFVYAASTHDGFSSVVRVGHEGATAADGSSALSAEGLFDEAAAAAAQGQEVLFDSSFGLPVRIGDEGSPRFVIHEISLRDALRIELDEATELWLEHEAYDYAYTQSRECFCLDGRAVRIMVEDGIALGRPLRDPSAEPSANVVTIGDHLAEIRRLLDGHVIAIDATFDPSTGAPLSYSVDVSRQIADEEYRVAIADLEIDYLSVGEPGEHPADDAPRKLVIVRVGGIEVSEAIAANVEQLIAAASVDGFTLSGGGFRDPQRQIDLRRANCGTTDFAVFELPADQCSPPTARPGRSQHELGLAIDFTNDGRLITSRTDPAFLWLTEHAADFGLVNLPSEPWHWSTTGN